MFVSKSKLWNTFHKPKDVAHACELSLKNLRVDVIGELFHTRIDYSTGRKLRRYFSDLYIMHFPIAFLGDENFTAQRDQNDPREVKARFYNCL